MLYIDAGHKRCSIDLIFEKLVIFMYYLKMIYITKTYLFKYTENIPPENENVQVKKKSDILPISAQNIDCGAVIASTHKLCFWAEIRKIMCTTLNPSFTI